MAKAKPKAVPPGLVWCTECATQLRKDKVEIRAHYLKEHRIDPSRALFQTVLNNFECLNGEIRTGVVRSSPTDGVDDYDRKHSGKLPGQVSAGAFGMKRR